EAVHSVFFHEEVTASIRSYFYLDWYKFFSTDRYPFFLSKHDDFIAGIKSLQTLRLEAIAIP
ncbi:hypothetical protein, partial [uncultured Vibrio sp.]|uniref:hypothetical protein n=1 Tax=uncultured Vibrio sp. TaxID=114054 RepID=UPI002610CA44